MTSEHPAALPARKNLRLVGLIMLTVVAICPLPLALYFDARLHDLGREDARVFQASAEKIEGTVIGCVGEHYVTVQYPVDDENRQRRFRFDSPFTPCATAHPRGSSYAVFVDAGSPELVHGEDPEDYVSERLISMPETLGKYTTITGLLVLCWLIGWGFPGHFRRRRES